MWTADNRPRYNRDKLRYPSDLTDAEWAHIEPLIPPGKPGGGKRRVAIREVINGVMYILSTGCQWRALPKDLPPRSTVHDYLGLWNWDGTLDRIHHALYLKCREKAAREASPTACIIDSQSVKSAEKGGLASTATASMPASSRARSGRIRKACCCGIRPRSRWRPCSVCFPFSGNCRRQRLCLSPRPGILPDLTESQGRSGEGLRRPAQALGGQRTIWPIGQGLGNLQARLHQARAFACSENSVILHKADGLTGINQNPWTHFGVRST